MKTQRIKRHVLATIQKKIARLHTKVIDPDNPIVGWIKMTIEQKLGALASRLTELRKTLVCAVEHNQKYRSSYLWHSNNFKHVARYAEFDLDYWIDGHIMSIDCGAPCASCRHLYYRSIVLKNGKKTNFSTVNAHVRRIDAYLASIEEIRTIADDEITNSLGAELSKRIASGEMVGIDIGVESNGPPMDPAPRFDPLQEMTL